MFATHDEDTIIKLIDFGEAIYFKKNQKILKTCGTVTQWPHLTLMQLIFF